MTSNLQSHFKLNLLGQRVFHHPDFSISMTALNDVDEAPLSSTIIVFDTPHSRIEDRMTTVFDIDTAHEMIDKALDNWLGLYNHPNVLSVLHLAILGGFFDTLPYRVALEAITLRTLPTDMDGLVCEQKVEQKLSRGLADEVYIVREDQLSVFMHLQKGLCPDCEKVHNMVTFFVIYKDINIGSFPTLHEYEDIETVLKVWVPTLFGSMKMALMKSQPIDSYEDYMKYRMENPGEFHPHSRILKDAKTNVEKYLPNIQRIKQSTKLA